MSASGNVTIGAFGTPVVLLNNVSAAGAGDWQWLTGRNKTVTIYISGTATVQLETQDSAGNVLSVGGAQTTSIAVETTYIGWIRANVTSYTDGTIRVECYT